MPREFRLPDIGEGLTEAEIVRWLVAEGESVEADQPIVEVETDKAVVEIPSPYAGVVISHGGAEGEVIEVGAVLVTIGEPGESAEATPDVASEEPGEGAEVFAAPEPIVGTLSEDAESLSAPASAPAEAPAAVKALPIVRKLARDNDIDLETVDGSGPGGRITRSDVEAAIAGKGAGAPSSSGAISTAAPTARSRGLACRTHKAAGPVSTSTIARRSPPRSSTTSTRSSSCR
jgi:pyruvate dehydrogenase E2 component (dihydrolipoamide acetyltransferase)